MLSLLFILSQDWTNLNHDFIQMLSALFVHGFCLGVVCQSWYTALEYHPPRMLTVPRPVTPDQKICLSTTDVQLKQLNSTVVSNLWDKVMAYYSTNCDLFNQYPHAKWCFRNSKLAVPQIDEVVCAKDHWIKGYVTLKEKQQIINDPVHDLFLARFYHVDVVMLLQDEPTSCRSPSISFAGIGPHKDATCLPEASPEPTTLDDQFHTFGFRVDHLSDCGALSGSDYRFNSDWTQCPDYGFIVLDPISWRKQLDTIFGHMHIRRCIFERSQPSASTTPADQNLSFVVSSTVDTQLHHTTLAALNSGSNYNSCMPVHLPVTLQQSSSPFDLQPGLLKMIRGASIDFPSTRDVHLIFSFSRHAHTFICVLQFCIHKFLSCRSALTHHQLRSFKEIFDKGSPKMVYRQVLVLVLLIYDISYVCKL